MPDKCIKCRQNWFWQDVGHFQYMSVTQSVRAPPYRDRRGSAARRSCLPSSQVALGPFFRRCSVSFHGQLACLPPATWCSLQGDSKLEWRGWVCPGHAAPRGIFSYRGERSWGFLPDMRGPDTPHPRWMEEMYRRVGEMKRTEGIGMAGQSKLGSGRG